MKMAAKLLGFIALAAVIGFSFGSCQQPTNSAVSKTKTGSISGRATFLNGSSHGGITVTLEQSDGLRSVAAVSAARSIASGGSPARALAGQTQAAADGSYKFTNLAAGIYTVYASSPDSTERAVAMNVTLQAGRALTDVDLKLTATGSVSGRVQVDSKAEGNLGFLVCAAGTSYMAATDDSGNFTISGIPAGSGYHIIIIKGKQTFTWTSPSQPVTVSAGGTTALNPAVRSFTASELTSGSGGVDGLTPHIGDNGNWWIGDEDTGIPATGPTGPQGPGGTSPIITIGENGSWFINGVDTGVAATGPQGPGGASPVITIGQNGNWTINGVDTGVAATGPQGSGGASPVITIGQNGNWTINGVDTGVAATGPQGKPAIDPDHTHQWGNWIVVSPATSTTEGLETRVCINDPAHIETRYTPVGESVPGDTLAEQLTWLSSNAESNTIYALALTADEEIAPRTLFYGGKSNITITLYGNPDETTVSLVGNGSLFTVENGVTLELYRNTTLRGHDNNYASLIRVNDGGTLRMKAGSKISGNSSSSSLGGGVFVNSGTFVMSGGEISDNSSSSGGGVYVYNNGTFEMSGGEISGNSGGGVYVYNNGTFEMSGGEISGNSGGGVYVVGNNSTFEMSGGVISDNSGGGVNVTNSSTFEMSGGVISGNSSSSGGGVDVHNGTFEMSGGVISGNSSSSDGGGGGGVLVDNNSTFEMSGGVISGNSSSSDGGGVFVSYSSTFEMSGGAISDNSSSSVNRGGGGVYMTGGGTFEMSGGVVSGNSSSSGGGVYVGNGTFEMSGGVISGNSSSSVNGDGGGGVCVSYNGTFEMSGGEISGNSSSSGGGVYVGNGTFEMSGGVISGNSSSSVNGDGGGGVCVSYNGTFEMSGGEISGNSSSSLGGGGVCVGYNGTFEMSGGVISGNSSSSGGGVYVYNNGTFRINTGTIYGSGEAEGIRNTASSGAALSGTAQYGVFYGSPPTSWYNAGSLSTTDDTIKVVNGELQ